MPFCFSPCHADCALFVLTVNYTVKLWTFGGTEAYYGRAWKQIQMTLSTPNQTAIRAHSIQFVFSFMLSLAWAQNKSSKGVADLCSGSLHPAHTHSVPLANTLWFLNLLEDGYMNECVKGLTFCMYSALQTDSVFVILWIKIYYLEHLFLLLMIYVRHWRFWTKKDFNFKSFSISGSSQEKMVVVFLRRLISPA